MNATLSVQDLWSQIQALPAGDRRWLLDKLNVYEEQEEALTPYTMEELNARIERSLADAEAGRCIPAEEADREMEQFLATL
ncbi:MAG TPA: hypothetical protein H9785_00445 [Candidatus Bacteroides intestinavium]|uniref:Addiction module component n=1 Tax=Candidatus Bacteroides intestinavium TaxID=2838469 RepID=A0A9D2HNK6_9BACE|nr:hypothetical protein [Candidatus Bacteroides intestinavium]